MATDLEGDRDEQDQSEIFDEDNQTLDGAGGPPGEMRTFEEMPDVLDVTSAEGDADDDAALIGEELDDDEIIELEADANMADIEDDDLEGRMAEGFDYDGEPVMARGAADEVELEFMGDMDGAPDIDARDAAVMESDTLDDDDLEDLGYSGDAEPA